LKPAVGYDDSLDVFGVHGIGGAWGALASGLFIADFAATDAGWGGQVLIQFQSIIFTAVFAVVLTLIILAVMRMLLGDLRVDEESESTGLDLTVHSETAYSLEA
jgi:Amt family ammonium transporter